MRTLKDFLGAHAGETAWLFGKGPSLDAFDMNTAGPLRCAINDVVKEVPGCRYGFANDSVRDWAHVYRPGQVLFTPERLMRNEFLQPVQPGIEVVLFPDDHDDERLAWPAARLATEGLAVRRGTLGSAGQVLAVMGVRKIVCVGIDGGGRHAAREWHTRLRHDHAQDYNAIRDAFITACRIQGVKLEFFGADLRTQLSNGMKTIKILQNTFIVGQPVCVGEIVDASPLEADLLVAEGRATYWQRPNAAAVPGEAATIEPAGETAAVKRTRARRTAAA